jgi:opacity protein-like surface antigen
MTLAKHLAALTLCAAVASAGAQAIPTAKGPDSFTAVGGGIALFESDYGQRLLGGGLLYTDINPEWRVGFEGEARYLRLHTDEDVTETNYFVGPRYVLRVWGFRPYAKVLFGAERMTFPFKYATGTFFTYAPGGGIEYAPGDRVILRMIDFEYQVTPAFATYGELRPYGLSAGISWRLNAREHLPKSADRWRWK